VGECGRVRDRKRHKRKKEKSMRELDIKRERRKR
jgi:hypothetical protein